MESLGTLTGGIKMTPIMSVAELQVKNNPTALECLGRSQLLAHLIDYYEEIAAEEFVQMDEAMRERIHLQAQCQKGQVPTQAAKRKCKRKWSEERLHEYRFLVASYTVEYLQELQAVRLETSGIRF